GRYHLCCGDPRFSGLARSNTLAVSVRRPGRGGRRGCGVFCLTCAALRVPRAHELVCPTSPPKKHAITCGWFLHLCTPSLSLRRSTGECEGERPDSTPDVTAENDVTDCDRGGDRRNGV